VPVTRTILLVEDNPEDVLLLREAFRRNGFQFPLLVVSNGEQAVSYLKGEGDYSDRTQFPVPSLILLDLKMPGMDGFQVLQWIRSHPEWRCLPVIVLTTSFYGPDVERAYELGANSFLTKPVEFDQYVASVRNIGEFWLSKNIMPEPGPFIPAPSRISKSTDSETQDQHRTAPEKDSKHGNRDKHCENGGNPAGGKKLHSPWP